MIDLIEEEIADLPLTAAIVWLEVVDERLHDRLTLIRRTYAETQRSIDAEPDPLPTLQAMDEPGLEAP